MEKMVMQKQLDQSSESVQAYRTQSMTTQLYKTELNDFDTVLMLPRDFNISVLGPKGVGKTTLCHMLSNCDAPSNYETTRYIQEYRRELYGKNTILHFFDLPGMTSDQKTKMNQLIVKNSQLVYIVFDSSDENLEEVCYNFLQFVKITNMTCMVVLVANKCDVAEKCKFQQINQFANKYIEQNFKILICSALHSINIHQLIDDIDYQQFNKFKYKEIMIENKVKQSTSPNIQKAKINNKNSVKKEAKCVGV